MLPYLILQYHNIQSLNGNSLLKKQFANTAKFCSTDINKFILMLWESVYP